MSRNCRLVHASTILVVLLHATTIAAAQDTPAPGIAGGWEFRSPQGALRFVFDANGSGSMNGVPFQWALQGDELAVTMQGNTVSYHAAIGGDEMRHSGGDLLAEVTLTRAAAGSGAAAADTRIQGKWQAANGAVIEFRHDGTGSNGKGTFHYTAADGVLTFDNGMSSLLLTYQIEGNELVF